MKPCHRPEPRGLLPRLAAMVVAGVVGIAVMSPGATLRADDFQDGVAAFERGDFFTAWREIKRAAERDDEPEAQFYLGWMYEHGKGVPRDTTEAAVWYELASQGGDLKAMNNLASLYRDGRGVLQDDSRAVQLFRDAAEKGHPTAQVNLGWMFENGRGVPKSDREAFKWYREAAENGRASGQFNLALMYETGRGVPRNEGAAARWYRQAAGQGHIVAQHNLGLLLEEGRGVAKAPEIAAQWYERAAAAGYKEAQLRLARLYDEGRGVAVDKVRAVEWFERAAEQGEPEAQLRLAKIFDAGEGVDPDPKAAARWYKGAAENGLAEAQARLGELFETGEGVEKDPRKAVRWYRAAAEQDVLSAQLRLIDLLEGGVGGDGGTEVPADPDERARWTLAAAQAGDLDAQLLMARFHTEGVGVAVDPEQAARWFAAAAEQGDSDARFQTAAYWLDQGINLDEARAYMTELVAAEPAQPGYAALLGRIALRQDDYKAATDSLERSINLDSDQPRVMMALGKAHAATGDLAAARLAWVGALVNAQGAPDLMAEVAALLEGDGTPLPQPRLLTLEEVAEAQGLLRDHGFEPGPADGIAGERTVKAAAAFRQRVGLEPSERVDELLLVALREAELPPPEPIVKPPPPPTPRIYGDPLNPEQPQRPTGSIATPSAPRSYSPGSAAAAPPPPRNDDLAREADLLFWRSIIGSNNPADYQAYLGQFPNGIYAPLARNRLAELGG